MKTKVKMELDDATIRKVISLEILFGTKSKAEIVAMAVSLLYSIETVKTGNGNVYVEYPDGTRKKLVIG